MVDAFFTHLRQDEIIPMGIINIMLFAMGIIVAYGHFFLLPL
ncbi:MAG: hypothetical protein R6U51_06740 [Anaerolineales bacterium]